jgi:hypothetical protein
VKLYSEQRQKRWGCIPTPARLHEKNPPHDAGASGRRNTQARGNQKKNRIFKLVSLSKKSDPSQVRDKLFEKIGFLSRYCSQKNPIFSKNRIFKQAV